MFFCTDRRRKRQIALPSRWSWSDNSACVFQTLQALGQRQGRQVSDIELAARLVRLQFGMVMVGIA